MSKRQRNYTLLLIPAVLLIIGFIGFPVLNAIRLSLFKWNGYSQNMKFIGLENYIDAFTDSIFWRSFANTMIYGFGSAILQNILGLGAALFINQKFKGRNLLRAVLYMPIMISAFLMGQIVYYIFQFDGGVLNEMLGWVGIDPIYWMGNGWAATIIITLVNSWQFMGLSMVIYLAGLQNIPTMYKEAARLDGSNKFQEFKFITFPLLIPSITTAVITNLINSFKMYDLIVSMSGGGPNRQSMSLSYYVSLLYFNDEKAGYASAIGFLIFIIILVITLPINAYLRRKEVQY